MEAPKELHPMKVCSGPRALVLVGIALTAKASCHGAAFVSSSSQKALYSRSALVVMQAKPKRGSVVDSYQTVSVNCAKCGERLFRYKKKNGTKSKEIGEEGDISVPLIKKKSNISLTMTHPDLCHSV